MDAACLVNLGTDANVTKVSPATTVTVWLATGISSNHLLFVSTLVRVTSSGCLSNPCTMGICYQLNQVSASYICICPDGTLSLTCNTTSKIFLDFVHRHI